MTQRNLILFGAVAGLYLLTGVTESWNLTLNILNFALLATIAALGVNIQWGYAGLFSVGTMGFTALGGLAVVLVSARPNVDNWQAGGWGVVLGLVLGALTMIAAIFAWKLIPKGRLRALGTAAVLIGGFLLTRAVFDPAVLAVEAINPQNAGNVGGLGLPSLLAWPVGGLLAALVGWAIGKTAGLAVRLSGHCDLGHRRDHRRGDEERGLAGARRQEHQPVAAPLAGPAGG